MATGTAWSSKEALQALSTKPIGRDIATQVAAKLVRDGGRRGVWKMHKDYCGHGLIFLNGSICLVSVHDGFAHDGRVLKSWSSQDDFVAWLEKQSDYSLSGADERDEVLFTADPFAVNNQRLTADRLRRYLAGERYP